MSDPCISAIIPNFNHAKFLPRSVGSFLNQPLLPSEIIVVDDASTDNSLDVLNALAQQLADWFFASLRGERAPYFTMTGVPFFFPADVHIYFAPSDRPTSDAIDLTQVVIAMVQQGIQALDPTSFRSAFREALETLLKIEGGPGLAELTITQQILQADRARISTLLAAKPQTLFSEMGNRDFGLGGSLHVFNWLFSYIPIPPLSLATVLATIANPPYDITLGTHTRPRLILSHGSLQNVGHPEPRPAGAVHLTLEAVFHNPLEDELDELENKIRVALVEIQKKFRAGSPLMQAITNIDDSSSHIGHDIAALTSLITSARAELTSLRSEADEIAARVANLQQSPVFRGGLLPG